MFCVRDGTIKKQLLTEESRMDQAELTEELLLALTELGVPVHAEGEALFVDGVRIAPTLVARAHPTPADLTQVLHENRGRLPAMIVSDRVSEAGRAVLRDAGWGWLDRRGDLRLWAPGIRIEATVPGQHTVRTKPLNMWTPVGLEIALAAMIDPEQAITARKLAPKIGRSAGAIHELLGRFTEQGLIGKSTHRPLMPDLFWETAAHWPEEGWIPLAASADQVGTLLGSNQVVRVDERAATMGGAKITAAGNLPARMYLTSPTALRRARSLVDREQPTRSWVRLAPVTWLPDNENYPPTDTQPWRVAHRVLCALRLAADPARGQEIVEAWGILSEAGPT